MKTLSDTIISPATNIETYCGKHNAMIEREDVEECVKNFKKEIVEAFKECDKGCIGSFMSILYNSFGYELASGEGIT